ncbi:MAG: hypothetical protein HRU14_05725 [Planctomycetes bacterium]|nr:hypothetical protein [Planctomycetota bacterium]
MSEPRDDIERRLQDWYGAREPSAAAAANARGLINSPRPMWRRHALVAAASLVALLTLTWWITNDAPIDDHPPYASTAEAAATEIAKNHRKGRAPEFATTKIEQLGPEMVERLGFEPVTPLKFHARRNVTILGGRYCSVGGAPAAQVACRDADGRRMTLYLWPANDDVPENWSSDHTVGDTVVTIWREGELLAGLAAPR